MNPVSEFIKGCKEGTQMAPAKKERPSMHPDDKKLWRRVAIILLALALAILEFHSTIELPYRKTAARFAKFGELMNQPDLDPAITQDPQD